MAKFELQWLKNKQERAAKDPIVMQYIDILGNEAETPTTWLPTNERPRRRREQGTTARICESPPVKEQVSRIYVLEVADGTVAEEAPVR